MSKLIRLNLLSLQEKYIEHCFFSKKRRKKHKLEFSFFVRFDFIKMFVLAYALCAACVYRNSSDASDATILVL